MPVVEVFHGTDSCSGRILWSQQMLAIIHLPVDLIRLCLREYLREFVQQLSTRLGATGFPFMCLLAYSGARLQLVTSVEGRLSTREVLQVLQQALDDQGALMIAERVERDQRVSTFHSS